MVDDDLRNLRIPEGIEIHPREVLAEGKGPAQLDVLERSGVDGSDVGQVVRDELGAVDEGVCAYGSQRAREVDAFQVAATLEGPFAYGCDRVGDGHRL